MQVGELIRVTQDRLRASAFRAAGFFPHRVESQSTLTSGRCSPSVIARFNPFPGGDHVQARIGSVAPTLFSLRIRRARAGNGGRRRGRALRHASQAGSRLPRRDRGRSGGQDLCRHVRLQPAQRRLHLRPQRPPRRHDLAAGGRGAARGWSSTTASCMSRISAAAASSGIRRRSIPAACPTATFRFAADSPPAAA